MPMGRFEINGLPPGEHEFRFWHERAGYLESELTVSIQRNEDTEVNLEYSVDRFDD